jgi:hypothetical protein
MLDSLHGNRRAMLRLMGSVLAAASMLLILPIQSLAKVCGCLPGSLSLLVSRDVCRQARRRVQTQPCERHVFQAAHAYVRAPDNPVALARFEYQVRQDFVAGRVTVVRGWVIAETELALLALVER